MISRRTILLGLGASALASPLAAYAQPQGKIARIGYLSSENAAGFATRVDALREGLYNFGYVEGKNLVIEFRWADGQLDRLPALAAELVGLKVDIIITHATLVTRIAMKATQTIPIVVASIGDAIASGIVTNLSRPGGNVTGSTFFQTEIVAKRLELLKEIAPRVRHVALLMTGDSPSTLPAVQSMEKAAAALKISLQKFEARTVNEIHAAFASMARSRADAVTLIESPLFLANGGLIAGLASRHKLASTGGPEFAPAGALLGYGANLLEQYRRAGYFVDKILKGTKPGDLPVEQASKFELIVNAKTARALGINVPNSIILRADKVIE